MTCAGCVHKKQFLRDRGLERCEVWEYFTGPDEPACPHYERDYSTPDTYAITEEQAMKLVAGA